MTGFTIHTKASGRPSEDEVAAFLSAGYTRAQILEVIVGNCVQDVEQFHQSPSRHPDRQTVCVVCVGTGRGGPERSIDEWGVVGPGYSAHA